MYSARIRCRRLQLTSGFHIRFQTAMPDLALTALDDLTTLEVRGADAVPFLQGQVSHDVTLLRKRGSLLAGLHNPQGRVLALLRMLYLADDHVLLVLPAELADIVQTLLTKFVLRAKVKIQDAGMTWKVYGVTGPDADAAAVTRVHMPMEPSGSRQLIVAPRSERLPEGEPGDPDDWRLDDIVDGIPTVVSATSGLFVAQMLNLDLLDAISFNKGCYTGQEVIARAHYRGQVKRRMQRFCTLEKMPFIAGEKVRLSDGRSGQVVSAAPTGGGEQELLVVTRLSAAESNEEALTASTADGVAERLLVLAPFERLDVLGS